MYKRAAHSLVFQPWKPAIPDLLNQLNSRPEGLTEKEALHNHRVYGLNILTAKKVNVLSIFWRQITGNPLVIILAIATTISYLLGESVSAIYIFWMIFISIVLGFWNEFFAERTIETLLRRVALEAVVLRDNEKTEVPASQVTLGDIVLLTPGSIVPADLRLIEASHLEMNESALSGESTSVEKTADPLTLLKPSVTDLTNIYFIKPSPGGFSFPSGQTAISIAAALIYYRLFPSLPETPFFIVLAILTALDRIYMGHHYPVDILGGAVLGVLCGLAVVSYYRKTNKSEEKS